MASFSMSVFVLYVVSYQMELEYSRISANLILDTRSFLIWLPLPHEGVDGAPARTIAFTVI